MRTRVTIVESERGWGQRVDEVREFDTYDDAVDFAAGFNARNDEEVVPDWYMRADVERLRPEHARRAQEAAECPARENFEEVLDRLIAEAPGVWGRPRPPE